MQRHLANSESRGRAPHNVVPSSPSYITHLQHLQSPSRAPLRPLMTQRPSLRSDASSEFMTATDDLIAANILLRRNPQQALDIYSRLAAKCHPVAYMNRSLCHLTMERPELAAMDAARAYSLAYDMQLDSKSQYGRGPVDDYAEACESNQHATEIWALLPPTFFDPSFRRLVGLAKLTLSLRPVRNNCKVDALHDLRAKAAFRLAYALFKCGGGALRSAITILSNVQSEVAGIGKEDFQWLGNKITLELDSQFSREREGGRSDNDLANLMATRYTFLDSAHYEIKCDLQIANVAILDMDPSSAVAFVGIQGREKLTTTQDIFLGDVLFTESTPLAVSNASMDDAETVRYCETCSVAMDIPDRYFEELSDAEVKATESPASPVYPRSETPPELAGLDVDEYIIATPPAEPRQEDRADRHSHQHHKSVFEKGMTLPRPYKTKADRTLDPRQSDFNRQTHHYKAKEEPAMDPRLDSNGRVRSDVRICSCCKGIVYWCSSRCKSLAYKTHHSLVCGSSPEPYLRNNFSAALHSKTPKPHERTLTMLLLSRILSWSQSQDVDPLDLPAVKLLSAGAQNRRTPTNVAWSYETHVVAPLHILQFVDAKEAGAAYDSETKDGQTINTLIHIIERQLRISTKQSWRKIYDSQGLLQETVLDEGMPRIFYSSDKNTGTAPTTYYGRVRPLCGLLSVASDKSAANVELVDLGDNRVVCLPLNLEARTVADIFEANITPAEPVLNEGVALYLATKTIRTATLEERQKYQRKQSEMDVLSDSEADGNVDVEDTMMAYEESDPLANIEVDPHGETTDEDEY